MMHPHSSHWGVFSAGWQDDKLVVEPYQNDPDPNPLIQNFVGALQHRARVTVPMVRRGWLDNGPGPDPKRGHDEFVAVSWDKALELLAGELKRVKNKYGNEAIYGGSYGWSSAGRFHHAQTQLHRFLNKTLGGYVRSVNSYSSGASAVILPHVLGSFDELFKGGVVTWEQIVEHTEVALCFGGMALKNSRIASGGISQHIEHQSMRAASARGCRFISVSPLQSDLPSDIKAEWVSIKPQTDTALMLGLLYAIVQAKQHDLSFLSRYCVGWSLFEPYLLGQSDGVPKTIEWAAEITGVPADTINRLAQLLINRRVLVTVSHSLQRAEFGEQPVWMGLVLAAALGQIGLPGGGYSYALGALAHYGKRTNAVSTLTMSQGVNGVKSFIPVARLTDMLNNPGGAFAYNGQQYTYPDIRLAYWVGGNPFHHHQDLNVLRVALSRLDTFVVHETGWTGTARHADIVLPATMTLEREDIGATATDPLVVAMHRIAQPHGQARDDYDIFADLAARLGQAEAFTEGRTSQQWLRHLYTQTQQSLNALNGNAPDFDQFWQTGELLVPQNPDDGGILRAFRSDPERHPLKTPSGKIEIYSAVIAGFQYANCPGYPTWLQPTEPPNARHPLFLVANQPATRLHSQLDFGIHSADHKRQGREVCSMHPADALARGLSEGDIVRLYNDRGACLACVTLTDSVRPGVAQLPTGAWFDPWIDAAGRALCIHGNPNVLTRDLGTSSLAQGCTGQLTVIEIERYDEPLPRIRAFDPPNL